MEDIVVLKHHRLPPLPELFEANNALARGFFISFLKSIA